jgi:hypothetical protein
MVGSPPGPPTLRGSADGLNCVKFFLSGRLFFAQLWCVVTRVRKSRVFFLLLSILSILSTFFPSFRLGLHFVYPRPSTVLPAFFFEQQSSVLVVSILLFVPSIFCIFGLGISASFLSSLAALAVSSPFGTLALNSCPLADVRSSHSFENPGNDGPGWQSSLQLEVQDDGGDVPYARRQSWPKFVKWLAASFNNHALFEVQLGNRSPSRLRLEIFNESPIWVWTHVFLNLRMRMRRIRNVARIFSSNFKQKARLTGRLLK